MIGTVARASSLVLIALLLAALVFRIMPAAAQEGIAVRHPGRFTRKPGDFRGDGRCRRMLLGCAGRISTRQRREERCLRLRRRSQEHRDLRVTNSGTTGHAESVQITYDPRQVTYAQLLQIFFSVAHDPTQLNRQGPDTGSQYRSTIFAANAEQARVAKAYIAQLDQARAFKKPIVTTIEIGREFYTAEKYHQDFLVRNPTYPYIVYNDLPKIENLKRLFSARYRAEPVLVLGSR